MHCLGMGTRCPVSVESGEWIEPSAGIPGELGSHLSGYRIGFIVDDPGCPVSSEVGEVIFEAAEAPCKGAKVEEGWPPLARRADRRYPAPGGH
jgi:hypothetical protein